MEREHINVKITRLDNSVTQYNNVEFPKRFNDVLNFYLFDLEEIFFPSYEYHIISPNGAVLKHVLLQSSYQQNSVLYLVPDFMINIEMNDIKSITWQTSRGMEYVADLIEVSSKFPSVLEPRKEFGQEVQTKVIRTSHSIDLRPRSMGVLNQGDLGTCGVSAIVSFLEYLTQERLSVLFLYYTTRVMLCGCLPHNDAGVELLDCIKALAQYGICRNITWPYDTPKFAHLPPPIAFQEAAQFKVSQLKLLTSLAEMKATLEKEVPFFMDVNFAPSTYGRECTRTGKVPPPKSLSELDAESCEHTVLVLGYDDESRELLFQNSWGTIWGKGGYGWIPYDYIIQNLFRNAYTWDGPLPIELFSSKEDVL